MNGRAGKEGEVEVPRKATIPKALRCLCFFLRMRTPPSFKGTEPKK